MSHLVPLCKGGHEPIISILIFGAIALYIKNKIAVALKKFNYKRLIEANIQKGKEYELVCGEYYEKLGYDVEYNGINYTIKDGGIDLICFKNDELKLLIQCKNYDQEKSINHEKIKVFHSNATKYLDLNNEDRKKVRLRYAVPNAKVFDYSALTIFRDSYYNCRYELIS